MTATEKLRKQLDERGIKWGTGFGGDTFWTGRHGIEWRWDKANGNLAMFTHAITPEQAIEATLGDSDHDQLKSENDKLRELVRDAWGNGHPDKSCGDCEIIDECHAEIEEARKNGNSRWNTRCLFERRIEDRMRELGIEVEI